MLSESENLVKLPPLENIWSQNAKTSNKFIKSFPSGKSCTTNPNSLHDSLEPNSYEIHYTLMGKLTEFNITIGEMTKFSNLTPQRSCCRTLLFSKMAGFSTLFGFTQRMQCGSVALSVSSKDCSCCCKKTGIKTIACKRTLLCASKLWTAGQAYLKPSSY